MVQMKFLNFFRLTCDFRQTFVSKVETMLEDFDSDSLYDQGVSNTSGFRLHSDEDNDEQFNQETFIDDNLFRLVMLCVCKLIHIQIKSIIRFPDWYFDLKRRELL